MPNTIPLTSIDRSDRARKDYGDLEGLADSIEELGLIQPIVLAKVPFSSAYTLVAGGRRLRALELLGVTELTEGTTCVPGTYGYVYQENLREDQIVELELEENLQRLGMEWTEEILLVAKIHAAKQKAADLDPKSKDWGIRQTGTLLKVSFGKVQYCLVVAQLLAAGDKDILAATDLTSAIKVLHKRAADSAGAELAKRAGMGGKTSDALLASLGLDKPKDSFGSIIDQDPKGVSINEDKLGAIQVGPLIVPLSTRLFLGDSVNDLMPRMAAESFDHIVTDIPYGIDMDNLSGIKNIDRVEKQHDVAENVALMPLFLEQAFRLLKPQGFCVLWYDLDHHEKLQTWAKAVGFSVQRWPLVWCKEHRCKNEAAGYNFTKSEEYAMVLRKGNAVLAKPQGLSRVMAEGMTERKHYLNPFAKPLKVWQFIYDAIAIKGQTVLDPFAGECSALRGAVLSGLVPYGIELNPQHFNAGVEQVKNAYQLLTSDQVTFA